MKKLSDRLQRRDQTPADPRAEAAGAEGRDELFNQFYLDVVDRLDTRGAKQLDAGELGRRVRQLVQEAVDHRGLSLSARQLEGLASAIVDEILGLGPLEPLLLDPTISDILVNGAHSVYVERGGVLEETDVRFRDDAHLLNTINRIVSRLGRRIDESSPMVDGRLLDGSRVNAIIPPLAIDGPSLSIRRFGSGPMGFRQLTESGALTAAMAHYFKSAVRSRLNILVCGGTGSGKTTMLNALSRYISSRERVVTIEDSAELRLQQKHVVRLETRPPNIEGKGDVSIRDLVKNSLRMRPDRIIVGEVRADEVLDMIQAMNTGHDGSMTTVHANNVDDAFTRLMAMLSMAGTALSESMMMQMIVRALDLVVHVSRFADGRRRVSAIAEVVDTVAGRPQLNSVYRYQRDAASGRGDFVCSGTSIYLERFAEAGAALDARALK